MPPNVIRGLEMLAAVLRAAFLISEGAEGCCWVPGGPGCCPAS